MVLIPGTFLVYVARYTDQLVLAKDDRPISGIIIRYNPLGLRTINT
jgi:hypothetical protein